MQSLGSVGSCDVLGSATNSALSVAAYLADPYSRPSRFDLDIG